MTAVIFECVTLGRSRAASVALTSLVMRGLGDFVRGFGAAEHFLQEDPELFAAAEQVLRMVVLAHSETFSVSR